MKNLVRIVLFTLAVSLLYTGVGQILPQLESRPPPLVKAGSEIGPDELAEAGAGVFEANCRQCHKLNEKGGRGPDLATASTIGDEGARRRTAATGKAYTGADYLLEALCKPADDLVEGFGNIMPPQGRLLSGGQLLAVVAFLQAQGGDPTVKGTDVALLDRFGCPRGEPGGGGGGKGAAAAKPVGPPESVFAEFACAGCHALDTPERRVGPSMKGIGKRLSKAELYEALLDPDGTITKAEPAYPPVLMKQTLSSNGFYDRMKPADYAALVGWLAEK